MGVRRGMLEVFHGVLGRDQRSFRFWELCDHR